MRDRTKTGWSSFSTTDRIGECDSDWFIVDVWGDLSSLAPWIAVSRKHGRVSVVSPNSCLLDFSRVFIAVPVGAVCFRGHAVVVSFSGMLFAFKEWLAKDGWRRVYFDLYTADPGGSASIRSLGLPVAAVSCGVGVFSP